MNPIMGDHDSKINIIIDITSNLLGNSSVQNNTSIDSHVHQCNKLHHKGSTIHPVQKLYSTRRPVTALLMVLITGRRGRRAKIQLNSETSRWLKLKTVCSVEWIHKVQTKEKQWGYIQCNTSVIAFGNWYLTSGVKLISIKYICAKHFAIFIHNRFDGRAKFF